MHVYLTHPRLKDLSVQHVVKPEMFDEEMMHEWFRNMRRWGTWDYWCPPDWNDVIRDRTYQIEFREN